MVIAQRLWLLRALDLCRLFMGITVIITATSMLLSLPSFIQAST